ncbi:MAG: hypothetical protein LQ351_005507 [Letrouitia transgressa]|nr:MAG: hypothetical protein LQ351_005507 [Letrouitia transgressa]
MSSSEKRNCSAPIDPSITLNTTSGTNDTLTFYNDPNDSIDNDQLQVTFVYYASYLLNQDEVYINFFGSLAFLSTYPYLGHFHEIIVPVREGGTIFGSFIPDDRLQPKLTPRACIFAIWRASTYFLERPGLLHPFVATIKDGERVLGEWSIGVRGRTIMSPSSMSVPPMVPPIETTAASGAVIPVSQASVTAAASSDIISLRDIDPKAVENSTSLDFVPASLGQYEWTIIRLAPSIQPLSILMTFIQRQEFTRTESAFRLLTISLFQTCQSHPLISKTIDIKHAERQIRE